MSETNRVERPVKPPVRACRLTMALEADTRTDMARALRNLARRIEAEEVTVGVWGSPSDGAIYELLTDPSVTHDSYHAALRTYLDDKRCPNATHMAEHVCKNRQQCWEPCGELGHSEEHARAV